MDPLEWILSFVDHVSGPSKAMAQNVRALRNELKALQEQAANTKVALPAAMGGGRRGGGGASGETAQMRAFAAMWGQIGRKMQAQETQAQKTFDRLRLAEARAQERATAKAERDAVRVAKAQAKAQEQAARMPWFGGHKSVTDLLGARAKSKMSGMATGAADALLDLPGRMLSGAGSAVGGALGVMGSMAEGAAGLAYNLGKAAVSAQAMREDSVVAMTQLFGSSAKANELFDIARQANELFDIARQAAKETKLDTEDMIGYYTTLARSFKADEVKELAWTIADVESVRAGKGELFTRALGKLKGGGPKAGFGAFQSAVALGPEWTNVLPVLSAKLGKKETMSRIDVQKAMRKGEIGTDVAIQSIIDATNKLLNTQTGKAGEFAKRTGGTTWSGVISNIKNAMTDVLNMKLADDHPINKFKDFLKAIGASGGLLDATSVRGRRFEAVISKMVGDIFRLVGLDTSQIGNTEDALLMVAERAQKAFAKLVDYVRSDVFPAVSQALDEMATGGSLKTSLARFAARIVTILTSAIVKGIADALEIGLIETIPGFKRLDAFLNKHGVGTRYGELTGTAPKPPPGPSAVELGGFGGKTIPSFATGGIVPGPYGKPKLIIAHGGEAFLGLGNAPSTAGMMMRGSGGGTAPVINVPIQFAGGAGDASESDIRRTVKQGVIEGWLAAMELTTSMQGVGPRP